ncbi:MAG: M20 metallopeptidase family protein, partial [Holdemania filiformis]
MNQATQFRRDLHQIPETSFTEFKTKEYVVSVLKTLHCEVIELLETGAAAYFDAGRPATLAYRADMDALPIQEETGLDFASRHPGKMHACGHDGHMAMLLGFAQELDQLDRSGWKNNILLIFQPSEETVGGAKPICDTGIFEKYNVKAIFGTHLWPFIPAGSIASRPDEMMAHASEVTVTVKGKSTHCAKPDEGIDALAIGAELLCRLYAMEKKIAPNQYRILKFGNFHAGT